MRLSQFIEREPTKRRKSVRGGAKGTFAVAGHRAFVPMLVVWGAAMLGLSVMVLPGSSISHAGAVTGIGSLGGFLRFALAGGAALLGAAVCYVLGSAMRTKALRDDDDNAITSTFIERRVRPIDPASDLGSDSLDAPLDDAEFSDKPADIDAEFEEMGEETWNLDMPVEEETAEAPKSEPTLGELAQRGYDIEAPDDAASDGNKSADEEPAFTHKDFRTALIESCEGASCEASSADVSDGQDVAEKTPEEKVEETPAPQPVTTRARDDAEPKPIGRAGGGGSWSLTQFAPENRLDKDQPAAETHPEPAPEPSASPETPRELDLAEFAELPGRDAVWVKEEQTAPEAQEPAPIPATALEKLRQRPADELSLVEMVERFAAALHEHQQSERAQALSAQQGRDAALAEALKALTLFTPDGFNAPANAETQTTSTAPQGQLDKTEQDLREALTKLQSLRGAA